MKACQKGTWVEIQNTLLTPDRRSELLPDDSTDIPYDMRVNGFLLEDANLKEDVQIETLIGRILSGTLTQINPAYHHRFGPPVYELLKIGEEEKNILSNGTGKIAGDD